MPNSNGLAKLVIAKTYCASSTLLKFKIVGITISSNIFNRTEVKTSARDGCFSHTMSYTPTNSKIAAEKMVVGRLVTSTDFDFFGDVCVCELFG